MLKSGECVVVIFINICIFSQYGEGYYLKPADKAYLRGILEGLIEA
jgi:hypothetical protein